MDLATQRLMSGAAGASGDKVYVDDVFSANLYIGDGANSRTITTGIDLATDGGLTWLRDREGNVGQMLFDTERGARKPLTTSSTAGQSSYPSGKSLTGWTTTGFTLGQNHNTENWNGYKYVNWNFKKTPKFFDIVTWTGNGVAGRTIPHNLESVPGVIIVKRYDSSGESWSVFHKDFDQVTGSSPSAKHFMVLEGTGQAATYGPIWNNTDPTSSVFSVGTNGNVNVNGWQYVAYLFAHNNNDGDFGGQTGADGDIIKCGYYTGNGSSDGQSIDVGFEPQFIIQKTASQNSGGTWNTYDAMRGVVTGGNDEYLRANSNAAAGNSDLIEFHPRGFKLISNATNNNSSGVKYIYICIRRSDGYVGKPVELGTDVFAMDTGGSSSTIPNYDSGFPVDFASYRKPASDFSWWSGQRLTGDKLMTFNGTNAEGSGGTDIAWDSNTGWSKDSSQGSYYQSWMFKRHAGFDVVCYEGNSTTGHQIPHSLSKSAEMIWIKRRSPAEQWVVGHKGLDGGNQPWTHILTLNTNAAEVDSDNTFNDTAPVATHFTLGDGNYTNNDGDNYIAMLFASVSGISSVGSYTGDDSDDGSHVIDVGFTPRFLIIKRADGSADWKVYDTTNGFPTSGTANYLELNTTDARHTGGATVTQTTNGFKLWSPGGPYNANNSKYIYYAHA